jgi:flagellar basal body L-ring protein FlgH
VGGRVIRNDVRTRSNQEAGASRATGAPACGLGRVLILALMVGISAGVVRNAAADATKKTDTSKKADPASSAMDAYLMRVHAKDLSAPASPGSTWSDTGRLARMMSDVRAFQPHDLISVVVTESIVSTANGSIQGSRTSAASSQLTALLSAF